MGEPIFIWGTGQEGGRELEFCVCVHVCVSIHTFVDLSFLFFSLFPSLN